MTRFLNRLQPWGILLLRVVLGVAMLYNGWDKIVPLGGFPRGEVLGAVKHFCHFVATLGMPYWLGYVVAFTEFVGGICVILGLLTRLFAFLMTCDMLGAIVLVTWHRGYEGSQYPLALLAMSALLVLTGGGNWALDRRFGRG